MKKSKSSLTIQLPKNISESILAALTGEEVLVDGNSVILNSSSLKDLRSRWNTVMRSIEVSSSILKKMEF
ncbi:MAG: hypothetical protein CMB64_02190 [Euryarchaeota archaeon]|mgnify:FL=1|nr:hypothetical protein [Euryarchaeota archaeon]